MAVNFLFRFACLSMGAGSSLDKRLCDAAGNGRLDKVEELLAKNADVNSVHERWGRTALDKACEYGHTQVAAYLIVNGAEVDARNIYS